MNRSNKSAASANSKSATPSAVFLISPVSRCVHNPIAPRSGRKSSIDKIGNPNSSSSSIANHSTLQERGSGQPHEDKMRENKQADHDHCGVMIDQPGLQFPP